MLRWRLILVIRHRYKACTVVTKLWLTTQYPFPVHHLHVNRIIISLQNYPATPPSWNMSSLPIDLYVDWDWYTLRKKSKLGHDDPLQELLETWNLCLIGVVAKRGKRAIQWANIDPLSPCKEVWSLWSLVCYIVVYSGVSESEFDKNLPYRHNWRYCLEINLATIRSTL